MPDLWIPTFVFEENRLVHSLRLLAYPGDTFTSEESVRCAFAVVAVRRGDPKAPPAHERNLDEWNRIVGLLASAEPTAWVTAATEARIEEVAAEVKREPRRTQL